VRDAKRAAFDARALQSQMMIVALSCGREDAYNAFVQRHQRGLHGAYQEMTSHFRRLHGAAAGEDERDRYVTELANARSQAKIRQGPSFCRDMEAFVWDALATRDAGDIARLFLAAQVVTHPYPVPACGASAAAAPVPVAAPRPAAPAPSIAPPPAAAPTHYAPAPRERDARDDRIADLETQLAEIKRMLDHQQEPRVRRADMTRPVPRAER
jgi:hypothetical protein